MKIPIEWMTVQGSSTPVSKMITVDFFRRMLHGESVVGSEYVKFLMESRGGEQAALRVAELGKAMLGPIPPDSIPVYLRHDGRFELRDGHHRVGRMVAEGASTVECEVVGVDAAFVDISNKLMQFQGGKKKLYQPVEHPWFSDWEVVWPTKFEMIEQHVARLLESGRISRGYALDLGGYTGRITRSLRRRGLTTYCLDMDARVLAVAAYLDMVFGIQAVYVHHNLLERQAIQELWPREVTVIASVFHHFLKDDVGIRAIARILNSCNNYSKVTVFDIPLTDEGWIKSLIPIGDLEPFYLQNFKRHTVEELGTFQGRRFISVARRGA